MIAESAAGLTASEEGQGREGGASTSAGENKFDWENNKENVRPLRRGRQVASIHAAFVGDLDGFEYSSARTLADLKRHFEPLVADIAAATEDARGTGEDKETAQKEEGREWEGANDKLAIWWEYIQAVQDKLPFDEQEQFDLLERCSRKFKDDPRYKDDIRYLRVWTAYATHLSNADDLFKYLYKKGIGGKHAHFWVGWALYAENAGNFAMAEKLYVKGIEHRRAEPLGVLKKRQAHFMRRMRRHWINSQIEDGTAEEQAGELPGDEERRQSIFRSLSVTAPDRVRRNQAAAAAAAATGDHENRGAITGAAADGRAQEQGLRGGVSAARGTGSRSAGRSRGGNNGIAPGPGFAVFVEEEFTGGPEAATRARAGITGGSGILEETAKDETPVWADYGTRASRQKENHARPSRWTNGALGDRLRAPPDSAASDGGGGATVRAAVPFPVYVDKECVEKEVEAKAIVRRSSPKWPVRGGLSVRSQLDPKAGGKGGTYGQGRTELLFQDPLFFVKNEIAVNADEKRDAKTNKALLFTVKGKFQKSNESEKEEEQVEETRARCTTAQQEDTVDASALATKMDMCLLDSDIEPHRKDSARMVPGADWAKGSSSYVRQPMFESKDDVLVGVSASAAVPGVGGKGDRRGIRQMVFGDENVVVGQSNVTAVHGACVKSSSSGIRQPVVGCQNVVVGQSVVTATRSGGPEGSSSDVRQPMVGDEDVVGIQSVSPAVAALSSASAANTDAAMTWGVYKKTDASNSNASVCNASVVMSVNPREALSAGAAAEEKRDARGAGGKGRGGDLQRRLTFEGVALAPSGRADVHSAKATNTERAQDGEQEEEDLTINTKLVLAEMSSWFDEIDGGERDASNGGDGGNCVNSAAMGGDEKGGVGGGGGGHAAFEIFEDPLGAVGTAALLERECLDTKNAVLIGNPGDGENADGGNPGRCRFNVPRDEDQENQENLGCLPNPNARNKCEPVLEESVLRELDVHIATEAQECSDNDGDNDDNNDRSDFTLSTAAQVVAANIPVFASRPGEDIVVPVMAASRQKGFGRELISDGIYRGGGGGGGTRDGKHGTLAPRAAHLIGAAPARITNADFLRKKMLPTDVAESLTSLSAVSSTGSSNCTNDTTTMISTASRAKGPLSPWLDSRRGVKTSDVAAVASGVADAAETSAVLALGDGVGAAAPVKCSSGLRFDVFGDEPPPTAAGGSGRGRCAPAGTSLAKGITVFEDVDTGGGGEVGGNRGGGAPAGTVVGSCGGGVGRRIGIMDDISPACPASNAPPCSDFCGAGGGGDGGCSAGACADIKADHAGGHFSAPVVFADSRAESYLIVPESPSSTSGLGFPVYQDTAGVDVGGGARRGYDGGPSDPFFSTSGLGLDDNDEGGSIAEGCRGGSVSPSSSLPFPVYMDAPAFETRCVSGGTGTAAPSVSTKRDRNESSLPDGDLSYWSSRHIGEDVEGSNNGNTRVFRSIPKREATADDRGSRAGAAAGNLSVYNVSDDPPEMLRQLPGVYKGSSACSRDTGGDVVGGRLPRDAAPEFAKVSPAIVTVASLASSLASSLARKSAAGLPAGGGGGLGLSRISEGDVSRNSDGASGRDEDGHNNIFDKSPFLVFEEDDGADAAGYIATRSSCPQRRSPGSAAATSSNTGGGEFQHQSPRAAGSVAMATPLGQGSSRYNGGGGHSREGRRRSSLAIGEFGDFSNTPQSLGISWGGCSTIKRRGEDLTD